jgi:hypothetical protein
VPNTRSSTLPTRVDHERLVRQLPTLLDERERGAIVVPATVGLSTPCETRTLVPFSGGPATVQFSAQPGVRSRRASGRSDTTASWTTSVSMTPNAPITTSPVGWSLRMHDEKRVVPFLTKMGFKSSWT